MADATSDHVGVDVFRFAINFGKDATAAVQSSGMHRDGLQVSDTSLQTFANVLADAGSSLVAHGDAHDALVSKHVKPLDLHQSDFKFV
jgi:hypothetical protein